MTDLDHTLKSAADFQGVRKGELNRRGIWVNRFPGENDAALNTRLGKITEEIKLAFSSEFHNPVFVTGYSRQKDGMLILIEVSVVSDSARVVWETKEQS